MSYVNAPYYPIIYVRGFAMTNGEQNDTTADPFCGFNLGSTVYRSTTDKLEDKKPANKFIFESPVLRLGTDFGYREVYEEGYDIADENWTRKVRDPANPEQFIEEQSLPAQSIIIYRYYDDASTLLGSDKEPDIKGFAKGLSDLILRVRELVLADKTNTMQANDFRCYLVAHSMGGLVCRAFLQNPALGDNDARKCVDKVFTYATPHNGIDVLGMNVPSWLGAKEVNTFSRQQMASYLNVTDLYQRTDRVDWLTNFPIDKFFCLIGTNRQDYEAAKGLSRTFVGNGSDGLVKVANASVWSKDNHDKDLPCATSYVYRSHSGYFGIVNSEESYQNLVRFLFGDIRVDVWLDIDEVHLPPPLQGKSVNALYQFEFISSVKGKRWFLSRRIAEEDSVACRTHQELMSANSKRHIFLSSVFLANRSRVQQAAPTLTYSMKLGIRVPDYQIERKFWPDGHFEGEYLFNESMIIAITPPEPANPDWSVTFDWTDDRLSDATLTVSSVSLEKGVMEYSVPFLCKKKAPSVNGKLRFVVSAWNKP